MFSWPCLVRDSFYCTPLSDYITITKQVQLFQGSGHPSLKVYRKTCYNPFSCTECKWCSFPKKDDLVCIQGRSRRGGGVPLGSEEPLPQTKKGPPNGPPECPLEYTKRSTITVCLINYRYRLEDLNKFCYPISQGIHVLKSQ